MTICEVWRDSGKEGDRIVATAAACRFGAGRRFTAPEECLGKLFGARRILRRANCAGHDDVVGNDLDIDVGVRDEALDIGLQSGNVAFDLEVEAHDLLPIGAEDEDIGLADRLAEEIDAARGARHGIGHLRIGNENIMRIRRQVDHQRLVEPKFQRALGAETDNGHDTVGAVGPGRRHTQEGRRFGKRQAGKSDREGERGKREEANRFCWS